jgi:restriction system protein
VRDFRGAMMGRADKGISLTTGTFTADAKREAIRDGEKLVDRCEALELGLRPKTTFAFDPNCFDEFRQEKETGGRGHAESSGGASHMP